MNRGLIGSIVTRSLRARFTGDSTRNGFAMYGGTGQILVHALITPALELPPTGADVVVDIDVGRSAKPNYAPNGKDILNYSLTGWITVATEALTGRLSGRVICRTSAGVTPVPDATVFLYAGQPPALEFRWTARTARLEMAPRSTSS